MKNKSNIADIKKMIEELTTYCKVVLPKRMRMIWEDNENQKIEPKPLRKAKPELPVIKVVKKTKKTSPRLKKTPILKSLRSGKKSVKTVRGKKKNTSSGSKKKGAKNKFSSRSRSWWRF
jgi:hypothetical protein